MAPFGDYTETTAGNWNTNYTGNNDNAWSGFWLMRYRHNRRWRERNACQVCDKIAGWPDRKELEWFQFRSGGPVHFAEPGKQRLLCGRVH